MSEAQASFAWPNDGEVIEVDHVDAARGEASSTGRARHDLDTHAEVVGLGSHDLQAVRNLCTRAVWLKHGMIMHEGQPRETVDTYLEHYWPGCTKELNKKWRDD